MSQLVNEIATENAKNSVRIEELEKQIKVQARRLLDTGRVVGRLEDLLSQAIKSVERLSDAQNALTRVVEKLVEDDPDA